jgi:hypothetical protein
MDSVMRVKAMMKGEVKRDLTPIPTPKREGEQDYKSLKGFEDTLNNGQVSISGIEKLPLEKLRSYYLHQIELLKGYERNPEKVNEYSAVMEGWIQDIDKLVESLKAIMMQRHI